MQGVHQLTRNSNGGERETVFRMIAEDVQGKVGTPKLITSPFRTLLNTSIRNEAELLTDEVFRGLLAKHPPRVPPLGEQFSHPLELGSCRSQIEQVSPRRVTDLFRSLRNRFEANPSRHEFEELVEADGPFRGIEPPTRRNRDLLFSWSGGGSLASLLLWGRTEEVPGVGATVTEQVVSQLESCGLLRAIHCDFQLVLNETKILRLLAYRRLVNESVGASRGGRGELSDESRSVESERLHDGVRV